MSHNGMASIKNICTADSVQVTC